MQSSLIPACPSTSFSLGQQARALVRRYRPARPLQARRWALAAGAIAAAMVGVGAGVARTGNPEGPVLQVASGEDLEHTWTAFDQTGPATGELGGRSALVHALQLGLGDRMAAVKLWAGQIAPEWSRAAKADDDTDGTLLWPVPGGHHVRGYGSGKNAYHLAVDIAGPLGSEVLAAAPGIVGYVGNQMRGYGNLLILVHAGGRATFYAHNQRFLVVAGERVARGQPIAVLGSTGNSEGPHVHFELVYNERNCDPAPLFRADGRGRALASITPVAWALDAPKPRAVRCARRRQHPRDEEGAPAVAQSWAAREPLAALVTPAAGLRSAL